MVQLHGSGVSPGIAIAPLRQYTRTPLLEQPVFLSDAEIPNALDHFQSARTLAATQLGQLAVTLGKTLGEEHSLLFEIHKMMLEDLDYTQMVVTMIQEQHYAPAYAVSETARNFSRQFSEMDDPYMQARAADVEDISRRVLEILSGKKEMDPLIATPQILVSDDFAPSETAQFQRELVVGLITTQGSPLSHTAIFAKTMGIPAIIGAPESMLSEPNGTMVVMDGASGSFYLQPDEAILASFHKKKQAESEQKQLLEQYRGVKTITKAGKEISLFANVGNVDDVSLAVEQDAEGIGLFRSEFLYLGQRHAPSEEMQYQAYRDALEKMDGKSVIIRTLDIGADKQADYFQLAPEENPALGLRAIRICLTQEDVFVTQLRALLRASVHGNLSIMLPMITSVSEVLTVKEILNRTKQQLREEGISYQEHIPLGIMIETPAAAIISDLLAKEVDFFSIGTNDLTQYTLAVDRMNNAIADFCDPHHEAVLRLIDLVASNAHQQGIWVGICGELAADETLTQRFLAMGIDEFSVSPPSLLSLRAHIMQLDPVS